MEKCWSEKISKFHLRDMKIFDEELEKMFFVKFFIEVKKNVIKRKSECELNSWPYSSVG